MCQAHAYTTIAVYIIELWSTINTIVYILYSLYRVSQGKTNMGSNQSKVWYNNNNSSKQNKSLYFKYKVNKIIMHCKIWNSKI